MVATLTGVVRPSAVADTYFLSGTNAFAFPAVERPSAPPVRTVATSAAWQLAQSIVLAE